MGSVFDKFNKEKGEKTMKKLLSVILAICLMVSMFCSVSADIDTVVGVKGYAHTLVKCGNFLFTATNQELLRVGVKVYEDISGVTVELEDQDEVVIARTGTTAYKRAVTNGNYIYALEVGTDATLRVFEKSAGNAVTAVSASSEDYVLAGGKDGTLMVDGDYLYVAYNHSGADGVIKKFSLTNPAAPALTATFTAAWRDITDMVKVGDNLYAGTAWGYNVYADTAETTGTVAPSQNNVKVTGATTVYLATDSVNGVTYIGVNKSNEASGNSVLKIVKNSTGEVLNTVSGLAANQIADLKIVGDYLYILNGGSIYKVALSENGAIATDVLNWKVVYDGSTKGAYGFDVDGYILYVYCMNTFGSADNPSTLSAYRMEHNGVLTLLDTAVCSSGNAGYCRDAKFLDDGFYFISTHELKRVSVVVPEEVEDHTLTRLDDNSIEVL